MPPLTEAGPAPSPHSGPIASAEQRLFPILGIRLGVLAGLGVLALALLVFFDLGPNLAFHDDWGMAWTARHLPRVYPGQSALALPQTLFAALVSGRSPDYRLLRITILPFVALASLSSYRITRLLGGDRFWAGAAAATLLTCPLYLTLATTFMTDVPYIALLLAAAWAAVSWLLGGRGWLACLALIFAATLQRQIGAAMAPALTVAIVVLRRPLARQDVLRIATVWLVALAAYLLPYLIRLEPPTQRNRLEALLTDHSVPVLALSFLPAMLGLVLIPFLGALFLGCRHEIAGGHGGPLLFGLLLIEGLIFFAHRSVFPGDNFTPAALMLPTLAFKPQLYATPLFGAVQALAVAAAGCCLALRYRDWSLPRLGPAGFLLGVLALAQLVPLLILPYLPFDRYYLPVAAVLVPLAARWAAGAREQALATVGLIGGIVLGLGLYAAGEQDYQAWMGARDQAARQAYRLASPLEVNAGYEANAVYAEVPYYDRTGTMIGSVSKAGARDFSYYGPEHPVLELRFADPSDPRPGVSYRSLAPGRIVITRPGE